MDQTITTEAGRGIHLIVDVRQSLLAAAHPLALFAQHVTQLDPWRGDASHDPDIAHATTAPRLFHAGAIDVEDIDRQILAGREKPAAETLQVSFDLAEHASIGGAKSSRACIGETARIDEADIDAGQ